MSCPSLQTLPRLPPPQLRPHLMHWDYSSHQPTTETAAHGMMGIVVSRHRVPSSRELQEAVLKESPRASLTIETPKGQLALSFPWSPLLLLLSPLPYVAMEIQAEEPAHSILRGHRREPLTSLPATKQPNMAAAAPAPRLGPPRWPF